MSSTATPPQHVAAARFQPAAEGLGPGAVRAVVVGILALHGLAGWALLQVEAVRQALVEAAPVFVHLVDAPRPEPVPPPPPPPSPPREPAKPSPRPPAPVLSAAPVPATPSFTVPPAPTVVEPLSPPAAPAPVEVVAAPPSPPASPPVEIPVPVPAPIAAPKHIPASAVQYLEAPAPVYPRTSIRLNESGVVVVRVFIGADGLPREVQVAASSGHPRLDEAAVAGVRRARFKPPTENGQPISGWARIPIPFELER